MLRMRRAGKEGWDEAGKSKGGGEEVGTIMEGGRDRKERNKCSESRDIKKRKGSLGKREDYKKKEHLGYTNGT